MKQGPLRYSLPKVETLRAIELMAPEDGSFLTGRTWNPFLPLRAGEISPETELRSGCEIVFEKVI